jgi:hypothetical protein
LTKIAKAESSLKRFLVLLFFFPLLIAFSPAPQSGDIALNIEAGIRGWYRPGQWIPIQVSVDSTNVVVQGFLQVRVGGGGTSTTQSETTYKTPFTIAQGDSKRVFLYVSPEEFTDEIQVELVDQDGDVVTSERAQLDELDYNDILYAVITDSSAGAPDVSREPIGRGRNEQVAWRIEDIPPNADALRSIDVLVFTDVDSGDLSTDQQTAIRNWTASGGHLIVTGGPNWQRTTSGLIDMLPTVPDATITLGDIRALADFVRLPDEALRAETLVSDNAPVEGALVLVESRNVPLLVRKTFGAGTVDFMAVDNSADPLRSWGDFPFVWRELAISTPPRASWTHGVERFDLAEEAVSNLNGFALPSILQLAGFLFIYILLIGPINYLFLNFIKRRELAWITVPVLILVFTVFAYFTGFSLRGSAVSVNQVNVVQVWDTFDQARVDGAVGILSPRRTTYDVLIRDDMTLRTLPEGEESSNLSQMTILEGEDYIAENIPVDAAILAAFANSGYINRPQFSGQATWTLRGARVNPQVAGSITSGLGFPLEDSVVIAGDSVFELGDVNPGEQVDFDFPVEARQPARIPLGSRVDPNRPVQFFYSYGVGQGAWNTPSYLCAYTQGPRVIYRYLLQDIEFSCGGRANDEERRLRRRALLISAISNEIDLNAGRGSRVYLMGWSDTPSLDIEISQTEQRDSGTTLFIYEIPSTIEALNNERIVVPPGLMSWTLVEQSEPGRIDPNPDLSFYLSGQQGVAVRFTPLSDVPLKEVETIQLEIEWYGSAGDVQPQVWNWDEQTWDVLEFAVENQSTFIIVDSAYVGPQNSVQVLVNSESDSIYQGVNRLAVTLRGTG